MGMTGIIGGSGLYDLPGLVDTRWMRCETPWGAPSDDILLGSLQGAPIAFLPRHGRGHRLSPDQLNYRANIHALKSLGVTDVIAMNAVGSLREDLPPGTFVVVDQFVDRTVGRASSFFGAGVVAHVAMAEPVCTRLGDHVERALKDGGVAHRRGGTHIVIEGPQFSTLAESRLYRSWGCDVIGMTNQPEAKLAREAELCYATVAMVTDFDCWHDGHDSVSVEQIVRVLQANAGKARSLVGALSASLSGDESAPACACRHALDHAVMTTPDARDAALVEKLRVVAGRVL